MNEIIVGKDFGSVNFWLSFFNDKKNIILGNICLPNEDNKVQLKQYSIIIIFPFR